VLPITLLGHSTVSPSASLLLTVLLTTVLPLPTVIPPSLFDEAVFPMIVLPALILNPKLPFRSAVLPLTVLPSATENPASLLALEVLFVIVLPRPVVRASMFSNTVLSLMVLCSSVAIGRLFNKAVLPMMALPRPTEIPIIVDETHAFDDRRRTEAYPLYEIGDGSIAHDDAVGTRNRLAVGRGGAKHRESAEVNRDEVDRDHDAVPARPQVLGQPVGARLVDFAALVDWRRLKTRARRTGQPKN
jgi:hypothetical protein